MKKDCKKEKIKSDSNFAAVHDAVFLILLSLYLLGIIVIYKIYRSAILTMTAALIAAGVFFFIRRKFISKDGSGFGAASMSNTPDDKRNFEEFYQDRDSDDHPSSIAALAAYKNKETQKNISILSLDELVRIDETADSKGNIHYAVYCKDRIIGHLPKSYGSKIAVNGYYAACIEQLIRDEESGKTRPFIRIYW